MLYLGGVQFARNTMFNLNGIFTFFETSTKDINNLKVLP